MRGGCAIGVGEVWEEEYCGVEARAEEEGGKKPARGRNSGRRGACGGRKMGGGRGGKRGSRNAIKYRRFKGGRSKSRGKGVQTPRTGQKRGNATRKGRRRTK